MSQEDLATLGRMGEAFDTQGWDGLTPYLDPEVEFHEPPEQPGATVFHGIDAVRKGWAAWAENWTEEKNEVEEVNELADGRILFFSVARLRGRDGIAVQQKSANILTFRDGKVLRWQAYWDRSRALEAAGLSEPG